MENHTNTNHKLAVGVPSYMAEMFRTAQTHVERYFAQREHEFAEGILRLCGNRHLMLRGDTLAVEFFNTIKSIYQDSGQAREIGNALLYDLAHAAGAADARKFNASWGLVDPIEKLSVGPPYFAFTGFARVHIHETSRLVPNHDFVLFYRHENSFEAESWSSNREQPESPTCIISAGYSSGWCSAAFDVPLIAVEYTCTALGDTGCEFVMAPPERIEKYLPPIVQERREMLYIPRFFGRREHEEQLCRLAYQDWLTGLSNRTMFHELAKKILDVSARNGNPAGLLYIDLDGFKAVNDAYGHAAGDDVLRTVANRMSTWARKSDTVARLSGDEFAILLANPRTAGSVVEMAKEIIRLVNDPIAYQGRMVHVGASVGCIFLKTGPHNLESLLTRADSAMYQAKAAGKNRCHLVEI